MNDRDTETTLSRRRLLRTTGVGLTGLAATPALASAQEANNTTEGGNDSGTGRRIQTRAIIPETGRVTKDENYTGFLVQLTARLEGTDVASGDLSCSFANWQPENTTVYEAQLVDKVGEERETIATTVYLPSDVDLRAGDLLVIGEQHNCSGAYIGIRLENIMAANRERGYVEVGATGNESGNAEPGSSGAFGPGFGPLAALSGLVGGAYALARRGSGE